MPNSLYNSPRKLLAKTNPQCRDAHASRCTDCPTPYHIVTRDSTLIPNVPRLATKPQTRSHAGHAPRRMDHPKPSPVATCDSALNLIARSACPCSCEAQPDHSTRSHAASRVATQPALQSARSIAACNPTVPPDRMQHCESQPDQPSRLHAASQLATRSFHPITCSLACRDPACSPDRTQPRVS